MSQSVDLNADMGEGYGPWRMGDDAGLLQVVTSANIACGQHAGDWDTMATTMRAAAQQGVGIGAHPGFADLQGFGRRRVAMPAESVAHLVAYQVGAAQGVARACGTALRHLKLHGALANMAAEDEALARACFQAALAVAPDLVVIVIAGTAQQRAAQALGCRVACEIFADRAYTDDGLLMDRSQPGAVIHDPAVAAQRVLAMLRAGAIIAASGKHLPCAIDTVCVHGDTAEALYTARSIRALLEVQGITLRRFEGRAP
ncbi:MAG: LamB/YcsF family protein [Roseivivax sp.]|nr:LamB/YcsF family protein [Roseivivax sp.]